MKELNTELAREQCRNVICNPDRTPTGWGNILQAHLSNIACIRSRGDAHRICLHASNDMLVRPGVECYLAHGHNFCNRRIVHGGTRWRFGTAALADSVLSTLRNRLGNIDVIGSQIEGSAYEAGVLFAIADMIGTRVMKCSELPYPREEVWFSTLAHGLKARIDGKPYVFSELHRFDRSFWKVRDVINPLIGTESRHAMFIQRVIEYGMIKTGFRRTNRYWVDRVAADDVRSLVPYQTLDDGNNIWQIFERHGLYGVKRVPRRINSPLRRYIDSMGLILARAPIHHGRDQRATSVSGAMVQNTSTEVKHAHL